MSRRRLLAGCLSELIGTALLVGVGLSIVIVDFAPHGPLAAILPSVPIRRAITGLLFGATGMSIALSRVGKISGAHINPVISLAFWVEGSLPGRAVLPYMASQLLGAVIGAVPLLAWGSWGSSVGYGDTSPGPAGVGAAFAGEAISTFVLVVGVLVFVGHRRLRPFTPAIFPPMYAVLVWLEAAYSGTSTNPARSLGPDVVGLAWHDYWLYWAAPVAGTIVALLARRLLPWVRTLHVDVARVAHFEEHELLRPHLGRSELEARRRLRLASHPQQPEPAPRRLGSRLCQSADRDLRRGAGGGAQ